MTVIELRLLIDACMLVLILLVQLIIYPSFTYCETKHLVRWHSKYSARLATIVIPLMLGQLLISGFQLFKNINKDSLIYAGMVGVLWAITFIIFVPIHKLIASGKSKPEDLAALVKKNWIRTMLWILLFLYTLFFKLELEF